MDFSVFIECHSDFHNIILKHVSYPPKPYTYWYIQHSLFPYPLLTIHLLSITTDLSIRDIICKWNHTYMWYLLLLFYWSIVALQCWVSIFFQFR